MKTYTKHIFFSLAFSLLLLFSNHLYAQSEGSVYSVTGRGGVGTTFVSDYQAIGINPANIAIRKNYRDPKFTFGLLEGNVAFSSEAINTNELLSAITDFRTERFDLAQREEAISKFTDKSTTIDANVMLFGFSWTMPKKMGGLAFSIRDRMSSYTVTNSFTSELMFMGAATSYFPKLVMANGDIIDNPRHNGTGNLTDDQLNQVVSGTFENMDDAQPFSSLLDGTKMKSTWIREFNISYGVQLLETYDLSIYGGVGVRYLQGLLIMDFDVNQNGEFQSPIFSSSFVNPIDVLVDGLNDPTFDDRPMAQKLVNPKPAGSGFGLDAGITFVIKRNLKLGLALNNYGEMNWTGQIYSVDDVTLGAVRGQGVDNYNIFVQNEGTVQLAGSNNPLDWQILDESQRIELPTTIRLGASYEFFRLVHLGVDVIIPQNDAPGNLQEPLYAIGGDFKPFKLLSFSTGFNFGGNNDVFKFPIGVTYTSRKGFYELGVSTHDVLSYFSLSGNSSTISIAAAALRFKL
ncbi:DUF5723 family protein [Flammeovirga sp. SJP92]|uniref:DUF5723 family protein n=1 Tax=Flammeovirga sp. SJP92 TaxID=1775430 RepID=UPI000788C699|nr:DUF5723 family protein [Flammeovirga sp. SJP92]KXX67823.1 hypothetical protein AVL50_25510 [Flammeovirga sp. SJP92]